MFKDVLKIHLFLYKKKNYIDKKSKLFRRKIISLLWNILAISELLVDYLF